MTTILGTSLAVTAPTLTIPPKVTTETKTAIMMPLLRDFDANQDSKGACARYYLPIIDFEFHDHHLSKEILPCLCW